MEIFKIGSGDRAVETWGPTASVSVNVDGFSTDDDWFLENLQIGAREIVDVRQCFGDVSYIYALGNDQGQCSIALGFIVFVGMRSCEGNDNLSTIRYGLQEYIGVRISQNTSPLSIVIGSFTARGWLDGINIGQLEPDKGVCHATLKFILQLNG